MSIIDLNTASDSVISDLARRAFQLGLDHGNNGSLRDADWLKHELGFNGRIFHRKKLRQVYGAGFDIARAMRRLATEVEQ